MPWSFDDGFPVYTDEPSWILPLIDAPEPEEIFEYLGWPAPDEEQIASALQHIAVTTLKAFRHTRGAGFLTPNMSPPLRGVIIAAASRAMSNPTAARRIEAGEYNELPAAPGWLLEERLTLDSYRVMAQ